MKTDTAAQSVMAGEGASLLEKIKALEPQIKAAADSIEANRCLPDELIDSLRATGLFRVSWPRTLGGLELDPISQIEYDAPHCEPPRRGDLFPCGEDPPSNGLRISPALSTTPPY